ncbi:KIF1-binding protein [Orchesella cincta]|uniref:KIF-binding protein n=1 Tax=Orchesella cincta TaxID=48709 RepID=A0A1D2MVT8_ORCCI|nr:KIF1-binding protein [Orchesella cincta]
MVLLSNQDEVLSRDKDNEAQTEELKLGYRRCEYMLIYELTRYAILCSERDNQEKALELLRKAEVFYHDNKAQESLPPIPSGTRLSQLDDLNSESSKDMFTYVLFYLGQAYKIRGEKEKAVLYLHMVLRRQLEKGDYNNITWGADTAKMASVLMINVQAYQTARGMLVASTAVLSANPEEEKSSDHFRQTWADLGRAWVKFGVALLEASCDRLRDLEEQTKKAIKFEDKMTFTKHEKLSLEIGYEQEEYDTLLLIRELKFPSLDFAQFDESEMSGRFVRDFDEGRAVFLATQKWVNIAKEYYVIDEFATDYIDIITDYSESFKYLSFFEPGLDRQIKMHRRRINLLEELLAALNPKVYFDIFYHLLRDLAETYEKIYKLKVEEIKDRGESLRPKDKKLVKWLTDAADAHKRNLEVFEFDMKNPAKGFNQEYEKILLACILSIGRILGGICHDHPLHPNAIEYADDAKNYYQYFLDYLDRRPALRQDFRILYEGTLDMPELLDNQVKKIKHRLRMLNLA